MKLSLISLALIVATAMAGGDLESSVAPLPTPAATKPQSAGTPEPTTVLPDDFEEETPEPTTVTIEPTTVTPEPTTTTIEPTTVTPEPTTTTIEPTTVTPEPTSTTIEPTTVTPEPTTEAPLPTPAVTVPATSGTPEPTTDVPDNIEDETPEPTTTTLEPTTVTPEPTTTTLEPTTVTPEPTTTTVEPATATPEPTADAPLPTPAATKPTAAGTPEPTTAVPDNEDETPLPTTNRPDAEVASPAPTTTTAVEPTTVAPTTVDSPTVVPTPAVTVPSQAGTPAPTEGAEADFDDTDITTTSAPVAKASTIFNDARSCSPVDFEEAQAAAFESAFADKCAVDVGVSSSSFKNPAVKPTLEEIVKFNASTNCQAYFTDKKAAFAAQHCAELGLLSRNVTFNMAVASLFVESVPKVSTKCSKWALSAASAGLALKTSFYSCLANTGLYSSIFKLTTLPTLKQLKAIKNNTRCRDLFADVQKIIKKQPHCAIDANGTDIHAYEHVPFDGSLDWLILAATLKEANATVKATHLMAMATDRQDASSHAEAVVGVAFASAMVAMVAFVLYKRSQQLPKSNEERTRLLQV